MKKIVYILLGICAVFSSCLFNEEDKFPESSSFRVEKLNADCQETLVSAPNGWVMEYYPNTKEYGSYLIHMSFTNQNVIMTSATDLTKSEKSMYMMKASNGAELSFDTYNSILHMYSDPNLNNSFDGIGYGGDYEFMVVSVSDDLITLRGSKTGTLVYMHRLLDTQTFESYLKDSEKNSSFYFANVQPDWIVLSNIDTSFYIRVNGVNRLKISSNKSFPVDGLQNAAVAVRLSSFFINPGIKIGDEYYNEFVLKENKLVSTKDSQITIVGGILEDFYLSVRNLSYVFPTDKLSGTLKNAVEAIETQITSRFSSHKFQYIALTHDPTLGFALLVKTSKTVSRYGIDISFDKDIHQLTISALSEDRFDKNASLYVEKGVTAYKEIINVLAGTYNYSFENPFLLDQINFVKADGSINIVGVKEVIK